MTTSCPITGQPRDQGVTWLTWRRGDLAPSEATPRQSWFALDGRRHTYVVADETVTLTGYGPARQVTLTGQTSTPATITTTRHPLLQRSPRRRVAHS